jgi:hypothetical protein
MTKKGELTTQQKKAAIATGGVSALALAAALALIPAWEGKKNDPYFDSVRIETVCFGETKVKMRHYTDAECNAMLAKRVKEFQAAVLKWNPRLKEDPYQLAATPRSLTTSACGPITTRAYRSCIGWVTPTRARPAKPSGSIRWRAGNRCRA